jgi:hypothetical protein
MALEAPSTTPVAETDPPAPRATPGTLIGGRLALVVMGLGLLVIGFGWYGISGRGAQIDGSTDVRAQLPYLLSGGFLGLALVVIGAALFVSHTSRLERARADALVEARFSSLAEAMGLQAPVPPGFVVAGGAAYHSPECRLVDGREGQEYVTVEAAEASGLRPCRICGARTT